MGETYAYELLPVNFAMLPRNKQNEVVDSFRGFLNSLERPVRIHIQSATRNIVVGDREFTPSYYRFFLESGEPLDRLLDSNGFRYQRVVEIPEVEVVREFRRRLALRGGILAQTFTVISLPAMLLEGFLSEVYGVASYITVTVNPLPQDIAITKMGKVMRLVKGKIYADAQRHRTPREETELKAQMADEMYRNLFVGGTKLFDVQINFAVAGKDSAELKEKCRLLKRVVAGRLIKLDSPMFLQRRMLEGKAGKKLAVGTETLGCVFPFVSADVIETGGIFIGINKLTGSPVIYDPALRMNHNIAIVGVSGSGKSFASKLYLTRCASQRRDVVFYCIDPENEYGRVGETLGARVVNVARGREMGLDPLRLFAANKDLAASIIADLSGLPASSKPELVSELRIAAGKCDTLPELYKKSVPKLKAYLKGLVKGPDSFLHRGRPIQFTDRMVFNLSDLHQAFLLSKERTGVLHAASLLIFSQIWNEIQRMPLHRPKVVVIDELWLYTPLPASSAFLEEVSRRGRKRNVTFIMNSQRIADVLESPGGRTAVENSATKVLFRQDETSIDLVADAFKLSDAERETSLSFPPGEGILMAGDTRVPMKFLATDEEYRLFTTRAQEMV